MSKASKAGLLGVSQLLTTVVTLLIAAVLSRWLDKNEYSTYRKTLLVYQSLAPFLALGLPNALYHFLADDSLNQRKVYADNLFILTGVGLVFGFVMALGGNRVIAWGFNNDGLESTLLLLGFYALPTLAVTGLAAVLVTKGQVKVLALFNIVTRLLLFFTVVGVAFFFPHKAAPPIAAHLGMAFLIAGPALYLAWKNLSGTAVRPDGRGMVRQLKFGVPLGLAAVIGLLSVGLDKVIVAAMEPDEAFAVYVNGAFELPLISIVTASSAAILLPEMTRLFRQAELGEMLTLWRRSAVKCAVILIPFAGLAFLLAPEIMVLLYSEKYRLSSHPFMVYLLIIPIRVAFFGVIFQAADQSRTVLFYSLGTLLLNLLLSVFFVRWLGPMGAAISTVLVIYGFTVPYSIHRAAVVLGRSFREIFPLVPVLKIGLCVAAVVAGLWWVKQALVSQLAVMPLALLFGTLFLCLIAPILYWSGVPEVRSVYSEGLKRLKFLK
ncbi:MAG: oligosaccharide flippase family protein [Verrucomicrobiota bacterium]